MSPVAWQTCLPVQWLLLIWSVLDGYDARVQRLCLWALSFYFLYEEQFRDIRWCSSRLASRSAAFIVIGNFVMESSLSAIAWFFSVIAANLSVLYHIKRIIAYVSFEYDRNKKPWQTYFAASTVSLHTSFSHDNIFSASLFTWFTLFCNATIDFMLDLSLLYCRAFVEKAASSFSSQDLQFFLLQKALSCRIPHPSYC